MPTNAVVTIADLNDHKDVKLIILAGQIDESNLDNVSQKIDQTLSDSQVTIFALNLKDLEFINSKVIGYIASLNSRLQNENRRLVFLAANQHILDILDLVGLLSLIPHFESAEDFLAAREAGEV
jgi:anti-anti-sigma factor